MTSIEETNGDTDTENGDEVDSDSNRAYTGKRDSCGKPNGRGTLTWTISGTRFQGRFSQGMKEGRGCFYFADNSTLSGSFSRDQLNGLGVYTFNDGSKMEAYYSDGELNGPFAEYNSDGVVSVQGHHKCNRRIGFLQVFDDYGGLLMGTVDEMGNLTGDDIAYVYPDQQWALVGNFEDGEMKKASPAKLLTKLDQVPPKFELLLDCKCSLSFDESNSNLISTNPLVVDVYEQANVFVAPVDDVKGEGLFAKVDLQEGQVVSFYNGVRLTHEAVDARPWTYNTNTISLDDCTVLDVPQQYSQLDVYCATLGHKANHSVTPNCYYDEFVHPRFGFIKCIRTIQSIFKGTELTCDYEYSHKVPETEKDDVPQWFVENSS